MLVKVLKLIVVFLVILNLFFIDNIYVTKTKYRCDVVGFVPYWSESKCDVIVESELGTDTLPKLDLNYYYRYYSNKNNHVLIESRSLIFNRFENFQLND